MDLDFFNDLKDNMSKQILIFEEVLSANNKFREAIVSRDWSLVNKYISHMTDLSGNIDKLNDNRIEILINITRILNTKDNENLFTIIQKSPEDRREILIELFYKLKSSIIQVKSVFKGVSDFIEYKKELSKEIIDVLVKDSKGNVYSKPGRRDLDGQGYLVNRQL